MLTQLAALKSAVCAVIAQGQLLRALAVVIAACSVFMAPLGARAAHKLPVAKLKRVFASILYLLAAYMLYKGFYAAS